MADEISRQDYLQDEKYDRLKEKQDQETREKASQDIADHTEPPEQLSRINMRIFSIYGKLDCYQNQL